jgi:protein-tyrosine phosphatase
MPIEIINGLYLGSKADAFNIDFLTSRNIDVIINTTKEVNFLKNSGRIQCIRVPVSDEFPENEKEKYNNEFYYQLNDLCKLIDLKLQQNHNILIHCKHGKYRSTCLVISYLMYKSGMKLDRVYEIMGTKYPLVKLRKHIFEGALRLFEKDLGL